MALVPPHGGKGLVCCLLQGAELAAEQKKAAGLKKIDISPRAKGDLIMMGIGGFSPLSGFMSKADWKSVCENFTLADGTFWPVPVTLDVDEEVKVGEEVALFDPKKGVFMATMKVTEVYEMTDADMQDAGKVSAELAMAHAESEFEKYRIVQDRLFESDFDRLMKQLEAGDET